MDVLFNHASTPYFDSKIVDGEIFFVCPDVKCKHVICTDVIERYISPVCRRGSY